MSTKFTHEGFQNLYTAGAGHKDVSVAIRPARRPLKVPQALPAAPLNQLAPRLVPPLSGNVDVDHAHLCAQRPND